MIFVELEHARLHVMPFGKGHRKVLVIPGWVEPLDTFFPLSEAFEQNAADLRLCLVDLPGIGASTRRGPRGFSLPDYAQDLWELIDELRWGPLTLMGHSLGGTIACMMALMRPKQVQSLILIDSQPGGASPDLWPKDKETLERLSEAVQTFPEKAFPRMLPRLMHQGLIGNHVEASLWQKLRPIVAAIPPHVAREAIASLIQTNLQPYLGEITAPTLDVLGSEDPLMMPPEYDLLLRLPHCQRREIPGAGHTPLLDAPEALAANITEFLAHLSTRVAA